MRAIVIHAHGGPEVLVCEDVPLPEPGPGEARVRVAAAGVNFIDVYHRTGLYPGPLPRTPGMEGAGVVDAVGPGVTEVTPGDPVAWAMHQGSYAEAAVVPVAKLVAVPATLDCERAAAAMLQGMTAHYLAFDTFALGPGHVALVHAAAGGVGLLLTQIAKLRGATVIGTVSSDAKAELARRAGADRVIVYTREDFVAATRAATDGRGADVVYDAVGKDTFERSLDCLRPRGMLVLYGQSSGAVPPVDLRALARGSWFLTRPGLGHYIAERDELTTRAGQVFSWIDSGALQLRVDRRLPLDAAAEAHRLLEGRHTSGKLVLVPGE